MVSRGRQKTLVGLAVALALSGCARREPGPAAKPVVGKAVTIPAENVGFQLVKPDKEKRSGLYACSPYDAYKKFSVPWLFSSCADGKCGKPGGAARQPTAGKRIWLVGKLEEIVTEKCFLVAEAGSIKGGDIQIPVKYVRYFGPGRDKLVKRAVYVLADLPALPAGKYRAVLIFQDYSYRGDKSKISGPICERPWHRLVCNFEVRAAKSTIAKPGFPVAGAWSVASVKGLQTRLVARAGEFPAGAPALMRLELRHKDGRAFAQNAISAAYRGRFSARDARGKPVGGRVRPLRFNTVIAAGKTLVLAEFDAAADCGLRAPGRYRVRFEGHKRTPQGLVDLPASPDLEVRIAPAADISWGKAAGGLRLGLSPARVTLEHGEKSFGLRVCYENVGGKPLQVPDHQGGRGVNAFRIMFAGYKAGRPFYACFAFERSKTVSPRPRTLKPGERFSEEFRFPEGLGAGGRLPRLLPGESFTLRAGLCDKLDPMGPKDWKAATTLRSGPITVTRRKYEVSWGKPSGGLRVGLSPMKVTLKAGQTLFKVRVWYQNVGKKYTDVPVHKTPHLNSYRVMFAGYKAGKPFHAYYFMERDEFCPPGKKRLRPGERFSEEFPLEAFASRREALAARGKGKGLHYFHGMPVLAGGESLTLRAGLCAGHDPADPKDWKAATTLRSGLVTVTRAGKVSWGKAANGLRAGLAPLPRGELFPEAVHLHNTAAKPLRIPGLHWAPSWQFTYTAASGRVLVASPLLKPKPPPQFPPFVIPAGSKKRIELSYVDASYGGGRFQDASKPKQKWTEMLKALPAGKYGLTLTYEFTAPAGFECWRGRVTAGPVAVEVAKPAAAKAAVISIPDRPIPFTLVPPGKEKRNGLYAFWFPPGKKWDYRQAFSAAAGGKSPGRQRALIVGRRITLVGKLPGTVGEHDFFQGQGGAIKGAEIEVTAKYVRYTGLTSEPPARRAAYLVVYLPALPAGKYRVKVGIADYIYKGDRTKVTRAPPTRAPTFLRPLTCEFEVRAAGEVAWGKAAGGLKAGLSAVKAGFESGKPMELIVHLENTGSRPLKLARAGAMYWLGYSLEWHLVFRRKGGLIPLRAVNTTPFWKYNPPHVSLAPGQSAPVRLLVGGKGWQFHDARPNVRKRAAPLKALPPGRYTVTASYEHRAGHPQEEVCPYWHGKLVAGPVTVEVVRPAAKASWGKAVQNLQVGLSAGDTKFESGKPMEFTVHVRNAGKKARRASGGLKSPLDWWLSFAPVKGGGAVFAARNTVVDKMKRELPMPFNLGPGERVTVNLRAGGGSWRFFPVKGAEVDVSKPAASLPPGRYAVTARFPSPAAPRPDWRSTMSTGPVPVVVRPAAGKKP